MTPITTQTLENALTAKLMVSFGKTAAEATDGEMMRASALVLRDMMALREVETRQKARQQHARQVHYLSLEFLMGRSLMKNAYNLGLLPQLREALEHLGFKAADIFEIEPDAALGNGGLGRLAACYLDSMTTLEIPATGYSICYELGIFKQKIVEGQQVELPDNWKDLGAAWLMPKPAETQEVRFGGTVREFWDNGHLHIVNEDATVVQAVPCDMEIAGYGTEHVNVLRLWDARSTQPVLPGRVPEGRGGRGHGRDHCQGPLSGGQSSGGQVSAAETAVLLRVRHPPVHRRQAHRTVRYHEELP